MANPRPLPKYAFIVFDVDEGIEVAYAVTNNHVSPLVCWTHQTIARYRLDQPKRKKKGPRK